MMGFVKKMFGGRKKKRGKVDPLGLAIELGEQLQQGVEVLILRLHMEHAGATIAEQRLDDDVFVAGAKGDDFVLVAGDQRRRHEVVEMGGVEFFRGVAHMNGIVHHQGVRVDVLE